jgi:hypothetical protein
MYYNQGMKKEVQVVPFSLCLQSADLRCFDTNKEKY